MNNDDYYAATADFFDSDANNFSYDRWTGSKNATQDYLATEIFLTNTISKHSSNNIHALDLGVGTGMWLSVLQNQFDKVIGVDFSFQMLSHATLRTNQKTKLVKADIRKLPLREESFDFIWASHVFEYLHDVDMILNQIHFLLKTDGVLCIVTKSKDSHIWKLFKYLTDIFYPKGKIIQYWRKPCEFLLDSFELVECVGINPRVPTNPNDVNSTAPQFHFGPLWNLNGGLSHGRNLLAWHIGLVLKKKSTKS